jgi:hypothetical protein
MESLPVLLGIVGFLTVVVVLIWAFKSSAPARTPAPDSFNQRNRYIVPAETDQTPDTSLVVQFPKAEAAPVTPFEDFNRTLFVLEDSADFSWPEKIHLRDYPTTIKGDYDWARQQIYDRLRPVFPTIFDTYGWWAEASSQLELNPSADHPVAKAYLAIPLNRRPIVISRKRLATDPVFPKLEFFRYQFEPFEFDPQFLRGNQAQALYQLMLTFTGDRREWWLFSPARLRKSLLDRWNTEASAHAEEEAFAEQIRKATHANRFAALWDLPAEQSPNKEAA